MIVFYDPLTLSHNHVLYEPLADEIKAWLDSGADGQHWIRVDDNLNIADFVVYDTADGPSTKLIEDMQIVLKRQSKDGVCFADVPKGALLHYDDETYELTDKQVTLKFNGAGTHTVRITARGYRDFAYIKEVEK